MEGRTEKTYNRQTDLKRDAVCQDQVEADSQFVEMPICFWTIRKTDKLSKKTITKARDLKSDQLEWETRDKNWREQQKRSCMKNNDQPKTEGDQNFPYRRAAEAKWENYWQDWRWETGSHKKK